MKLSILVLIASIFSVPVFAQKEEPHTGIELPDECKNADSKLKIWTASKACLRGANIYQQTDSGNPWYPKLVASDLADLRAAGANYVNFSVPGPFGVDSMVLNQANWNKLVEVVNWAKAADLFIVLSFREGPGRGEGDITGQGNPRRTVFTRATEQQAYINMWKHVAQYFKNEKHIVGYDIMVEPHDVNRSGWRTFAQNIINGIRQVDASTPILVSPDEWGVAWSLDGWLPLSGNGLLYTVHQYEPFYYTHGNEPFDPTYSTLNEVYNLMRDWRNQTGQKVVVNEFGVKNTSPSADLFAGKQLNLLENRNFNNAIWLWEVKDPTYTYRVMDIRQNRRIYNKVKAKWLLNVIFPSQWKY